MACVLKMLRKQRRFIRKCRIELRARESSSFIAIESGVNSLGSIMSIERFSSLEKLITSTGILLSFLGKLKQRLRSRGCSGGTGEESNDGVWFIKKEG